MTACFFAWAGGAGSDAAPARLAAVTAADVSAAARDLPAAPRSVPVPEEVAAWKGAAL
ncbi:hypothetical protein SAMN04487981_111267 [Streptomyces sp. cf386]|uniref:hypothetical protein n=1 Tax=Streptomyces sp. cf386 TaxID=1761904 RepID=UPI000881E86D|nr:hypothetical protein [Streptomyces sp. cf386]SDO56445.1 hypothetical protein SAMN04487981_111267 [Streptomyces sp. cf386]